MGQTVGNEAVREAPEVPRGTSTAAVTACWWRLLGHARARIRQRDRPPGLSTAGMEHPPGPPYPAEAERSAVMAAGFTYKRCSCPVVVGESGRPLACKRKHGSWYFAAETRDEKGKRRQLRRGGFATQVDAQAALTAFAQAVNEGSWTDDRNQTVQAYLSNWLQTKIVNGLRPTTARGYRMHIDTYINPVIGHLRLRDVRPPHVEDLLRRAAAPKAKGKTPGPATIRRIQHAPLGTGHRQAAALHRLQPRCGRRTAEGDAPEGAPVGAR